MSDRLSGKFGTPKQRARAERVEEYTTERELEVRARLQVLEEGEPAGYDGGEPVSRSRGAYTPEELAERRALYDELGRIQRGEALDVQLRRVLREALTAAGMTQVQLAERLGTSKQHVWQVLSGLRGLSVGEWERWIMGAGRQVRVYAVSPGGPDPMTYTGG